MFEQIEQVRLAVKELAAQPVHAGLGSDNEELLELLRVQAELDAQVLRRIAAMDRGNAFFADGYTGPVAWLRHKAHLAPGEAAARGMSAPRSPRRWAWQQSGSPRVRGCWSPWPGAWTPRTSPPPPGTGARRSTRSSPERTPPTPRTRGSCTRARPSPG